MSSQNSFRRNQHLNTLNHVVNNLSNNKLDTLNTSLSSGTAQIKVMGSEDGTISGTQHQLKLDANGIMNSTVVNTVNVSPANDVNAELTPSKSFNVKVANQPNVKVEDLSSSLNAQHVAGTSRSLAVTIKGATNISDVPNSSTFLSCDSQGRLISYVKREAQTITTDSGGSNLSGSLGDGVATASCDLQDYKHIHFLISGSTNLAVFTVEGSHDNTTFYGVTDIPGSSVAGQTTHLHKIREATYRYYRLKNTQGAGAFTFTTIILTKLNL